MKKCLKTFLIIIFAIYFINTTGFTNEKKQYCDIKTITEITKDTNGNIINEQTIEKIVCDDSAKHYLEEVGVAKQCNPYTYNIPLGGELVEQRAIACEKLDGTYEIIPSYTLD